ncbi:MAG: carboxypeptidase regulatory-like domain-containing protein, partial [Gemmatimonadota bacterium]|nr:carboxypeptidase regulatory-like domain-containing protein [Gemmatimonadota bacterium]
MLVAGAVRAQRGAAAAAGARGRVTGTVVDTTGAPVAGATVRVMPAREPYAVSDDSGRFLLEPVPLGRTRLEVRRLG